MQCKQPWPQVTALWCAIIVVRFFLWPTPPLTVLPLEEINDNVQVVTCSTSPLKNPFDFTDNACKKEKKWRGFGWKMKKLQEYIYKHGDNSTIFVLVDGFDSFVNRNAFAYEFAAKWKHLQADVVVAGEEACFAVRDCTAEMVKTLYPNLVKTKAAFVNSPMAGYGWALKELLARLIAYTGSIDSFDDQLAITQMVTAKNIAVPKNIRIVHDTTQTFFGSFVHLRKYARGQNIHRKVFKIKTPRYTCVDNGKLHIFGCIDVGTKSKTYESLLLLDGTEYVVEPNCDITRLHSPLSANPVFWHGNGPGIHSFAALQQMRLQCLHRGEIPKKDIS